jgi:hypothetical protein
MDEHLLIFLLMSGIVTGVVVIVRTLMATLRQGRSEKHKTELMGKLFDKFGSNAELLAYLQTEAGQNFFKTLPEERPGVHGRILVATQIGAVATVVGSGILLLQIGINPLEREKVMVLGTIVLAVGLGFLAAAAASYALSRSLGLLQNRSNGAE